MQSRLHNMRTTHEVRAVCQERPIQGGHYGISTETFLGYSYFSLAIIWARNVKLASSRGFSTDNTHIWDSVCRIATAKI